MINFACFVPHTPLLIPEVAQGNLDKLDSTIKAFKFLEHELYSVKPDLVIVISPHHGLSDTENVFTVNQAPSFNVNFKNFGDLVTNQKYKNDIGFAYQIKESAEASLPIALIVKPELQYPSAVPLYYLLNHLSDIPVISINSAKVENELYTKFGEIIKEQVNHSNKRVAIIATGDLSHKLHQDSPQGYSSKAQEFDQSIMKYLSEKNWQAIIDMDKAFLSEVAECSVRSLLILYGAIKNMNYSSERLAYQSPFGIGYLSQYFKIQ